MELEEITPSTNIVSLKIPIDVFYLPRDEKFTNTPYFFVKWSLADKRYRISTSFKFLNETYGLRINIFRDISKIEKNINKNLKEILKYIPKKEIIKIDTGFDAAKYLDEKNKTEIFLISREWENQINSTLVFFSLHYWKIEDYILEIIK